MATMTLTDSDVNNLRCALEIARDRYKQNATELRKTPGMIRLAAQFDRQVTEATELIEALDELPA